MGAHAIHAFREPSFNNMHIFAAAMRQLSPGSILMRSRLSNDKFCAATTTRLAGLHCDRIMHVTRDHFLSITRASFQSIEPSQPHRIHLLRTGLGDTLVPTMAFTKLVDNICPAARPRGSTDSSALLCSLQFLRQLLRLYRQDAHAVMTGQTSYKYIGWLRCD